MARSFVWCYAFRAQPGPSLRRALENHMEITFDYGLPAAEAYFELFETTGWNDEYHVSAEELMRANATSQFMVSAYEGGRLVGFGRLQSDGVLHAMIYEMIVHPELRGKGLGSQILQQLIQWCRENHIREAQLFCAHGRRRFYERNGFVARPQDAPGMQMILTSQ